MIRSSLGSLTVVTLAAALGVGCAARDGSASRSAPPTGPVYTASAPPGVVPAGSELVLRTNERIEAQSAAGARTYSAQVDRNVVDVRGDVIVPAGSPARLTVVDAGRGAVGSSEIELAIQSLTVGSRTYNVASDVVETEGGEGLGANRRTAEMVGGGAVLGTLIGAIAGGGTGAAIGAAAGAAGGAAVQVLTRGDHVDVPAETLLTFRLQRPIRLIGYGQ